MKLHRMAIAYVRSRRRGVPHKAVASHLRQLGLLDAGDVCLVLATACAAAVWFVLRHADQIGADLALARMAAIHWHDQATHNEAVVVSMLNGRVILNGRTRTVCLINAAGDCEKNHGILGGI